MSKNKIAVGSIVFVIFLYAIIHIASERKANSSINPEIYPAFIRIENHALLYVEGKVVDRDEYERCKVVVDRMEQDYKISDRIPDHFFSAEEYYNFLASLGFKLPQFRLGAPATKEQKEQAMQDQRRLTEEQSKIIDAQLNKALREADQMLSK